MKRNDLIKSIEAHGYKFIRNGGRHDIYGKGNETIEVPRHREVNERLARAIIKKAER